MLFSLPQETKESARSRRGAGADLGRPAQPPQPSRMRPRPCAGCGPPAAPRNAGGCVQRSTRRAGRVVARFICSGVCRVALASLIAPGRSVGAAASRASRAPSRCWLPARGSRGVGGVPPPGRGGPRCWRGNPGWTGRCSAPRRTLRPGRGRGALPQPPAPPPGPDGPPVLPCPPARRCRPYRGASRSRNRPRSCCLSPATPGCRSQPARQRGASAGPAAPPPGRPPSPNPMHGAPRLH